MRNRLLAIAIGGLLVVAAVAVLKVSREHQELCPFDNRQIHSGSRAIVELEGERKQTCCIRCALTARHQGMKVRLLEVRDFNSGEALSPDAAFYVSGSPVVLCERHEPKVDAEKHVFHKAFDRCEPSVFAFARRERAEEFARTNGGAVQRLPEVLEEVEGRP